jgi:energy-coupling factor transporter ATP-binding protein EcfA2
MKMSMWEIAKIPFVFGLGWALGWIVFYAIVVQLFVYLPKALYWASKGAVRYTSALYYLVFGGFFLALAVSILTVYSSTIDFILDNWVIAIGWFFGASKAWMNDFDYLFWRSNINANFIINESPIVVEKVEYVLSRSVGKEKAQEIVNGAMSRMGASEENLLLCIIGMSKFILLVGMTGSGKSTYSKFLHAKLAKDYPEAKFLILDMTKVDFHQYAQSSRLYEPLIFDTEIGLEALERVAEGYKPDEPKLIVHIEECDVVYRDRLRFEKALDKIQEKENVLVIYSTSRVDKTYLEEWLKKYIDLRLVFRTATKEDSLFLTGAEENAFISLPGEGVALATSSDEAVLIKPLTTKLAEKMGSYRLD